MGNLYSLDRDHGHILKTFTRPGTRAATKTYKGTEQTEAAADKPGKQ